MLIAFIIAVLCLIGGGVAAYLNANTPMQTQLWALFPLGVLLLAMCLGGLLF